MEIRSKTTFRIFVVTSSNVLIECKSKMSSFVVCWQSLTYGTFGSTAGSSWISYTNVLCILSKKLLIIVVQFQSVSISRQVKGMIYSLKNL